jgi:hypothetical protein
MRVALSLMQRNEKRILACTEFEVTDRPPQRMIGTTAIRRPAQRAMLLNVGTGPACDVL